MHVISICLSDIPKDAIRKADNNKQYVSLVVDERKEADKFGNTHTVYLSQTKEDREARKPKVYVGNGKEYHFNNNQPTQQPPTPAPKVDFNADGDNLPF